MTPKINFIDLKSQYSESKALIDQRIQAVLDHGQYIMGPEMQELEANLSDYTGAKHCAVVSSGTDALLIALMALGIRPGDEVITTPFTFVATAEVIARLGATPVFVDIQPETYNIEPALVERAITEKTKAIIPVSLYGQVADMDEINAIADQHGGIPVIEDAAQSFGATYKGRRSCNLSTFACTSFFPSKPLGCYGDGGAVFTNDGKLAERVRQIRIHGQQQRYQHTHIGIGGRMDTIQCAVILAKLERFDWEIERRDAAAQRYQEFFAASNTIHEPVVGADRTSVWGQYTLRSEYRAELLANLEAAGIPTAIHYPIPLHHQPAYRSICRTEGTMECCERVAGQVFSLPMHPYLDSATQDLIMQSMG